MASQGGLHRSRSRLRRGHGRRGLSSVSRRSFAVQLSPGAPGLGVPVIKGAMMIHMHDAHKHVWLERALGSVRDAVRLHRLCACWG